jgi:CRISPR-associated Csx2 family protein
MRKVFLSFLGIGSEKEDGSFAYSPAHYTFNGKDSRPTEFVQVAEMELLGASTFDEAVIVTTEESYNRHFKNLESQLRALGVEKVSRISIDEDMSSEGQWRWFEMILNHIQPGDRLTVDLTHGYRAIPIVFSTAINFLQRAKGVVIEGVYYGAFDKNRQLAPIVDMKDFYVIDEWAEAVSRLVEDADARRLASLAQKTPDFQIGELNDSNLIDALDNLTNRIRDVDVHSVSGVAADVLDLIAEKEQNASSVGKLLLGLLAEKYARLVPQTPPNGRYDRAYFRIQLMLAEMLLEHRLYMQAFTVMRELIGSIGLIENERANIFNAEGRKQRRKADIFVNMLHYSEAKWKFSEEEKPLVEGLKPFYEKLKACGAEEILREEKFLKELIKYRNGFDHAWTAVKEAPTDIKVKGDQFHEKLEKVISILESEKILT